MLAQYFYRQKQLHWPAGFIKTAGSTCSKCICTQCCCQHITVHLLESYSGSSTATSRPSNNDSMMADKRHMHSLSLEKKKKKTTHTSLMLRAVKSTDEERFTRATLASCRANAVHLSKGVSITSHHSCAHSLIWWKQAIVHRCFYTVKKDALNQEQWWHVQLSRSVR